MEVKKVCVPMDFGIKNLALPNHLNVSLITASGGVVKANSLVLSYNSKIFKRMFEDQKPCYSVDLLEFTKYVVDCFVKILYSGRVDFEKLPFMTQMWRLAKRFDVGWLLKQFNEHSEEQATLELQPTNPVLEVQEQSISEVHYRETPDCEGLFAKRMRLNKTTRPVHRDNEIATSSFSSSFLTARGTCDSITHFLRRKYAKSPYKRTVKITNVSVINRPSFFRSSSNNARGCDNTIIENVTGTSTIANVVFSFPNDLETFLPSFIHLDGFLDYLNSSSFSFQNMFMFIEFVFIVKIMPCTYSLVDVSELKEEFLELTQRIVDTRKRCGWMRIPEEFLLDILNIPGIHHTKRGLLKLMCKNEELTTKTEGVKIVSHRGSGSMNRSRRYGDYDTIRMEEFMYGDIKKYKFFWKHPSTHYCTKTGACGFILCVVPISKSFDIRLSTRPEDYSDDIHCHPELLDAKNMHLVLRRDFSTKGKSSINSPTQLMPISWQSKPIIRNNQVFWAGESIPDNAYIALVVYYSFERNMARLERYY